MDVRWAAVILLGAMGAARAEAAEKIQVDVYVQQDRWPQPLRVTKAVASELFEGIGVCLTWHAGEVPAFRPSERVSIGIHIVQYAPLSGDPGAMALALPFGKSGSLIDVYTDRVLRKLSDDPNLSGILLGYVFVHELAHIMRGNDSHSDSGILKARWTSQDFGAMRSRRLGFADGDSERIHSGLARRLAAR